MRELGSDELLFFHALPEALPLYAALRERVAEAWPDTVLKVSKTQISFYQRHMYACVSLPRRKKDGTGLVLSLGLPYRLESPRVFQASEPYPGRWTNHLLLKSQAELDSQLFSWLEECRRFSLAK